VHVAARKVIADELPHAGSVGVEPRRSLNMIGEEDHLDLTTTRMTTMVISQISHGIYMRFRQQQW
jgi:hypothetical protein